MEAEGRKALVCELGVATAPPVLLWEPCGAAAKILALMISSAQETQGLLSQAQGSCATSYKSSMDVSAHCNHPKIHC